MSGKVSVRHLALRVRDIEYTRRFYEGALGLRYLGYRPEGDSIDLSDGQVNMTLLPYTGPERQPLEEGYSYVTIGADLSNLRTGLAITGVSLGGSFGLATAAVLGVAIDPAAALLGVPLLPGAMWGTRLAQVKQAVQAQTHLESILDSLERGEPLVLERP